MGFAGICDLFWPILERFHFSTFLTRFLFICRQCCALGYTERHLQPVKVSSKQFLFQSQSTHDINIKYGIFSKLFHIAKYGKSFPCLSFEHILFYLRMNYVFVFLGIVVRITEREFCLVLGRRYPGCQMLITWSISNLVWVAKLDSTCSSARLSSSFLPDLSWCLDDQDCFLLISILFGVWINRIKISNGISITPHHKTRLLQHEPSGGVWQGGPNGLFQLHLNNVKCFLRISVLFGICYLRQDLRWDSWRQFGVEPSNLAKRVPLGDTWLWPAIARWWCFHPMCLFGCLFVTMFVPKINPRRTNATHTIFFSYTTYGDLICFLSRRS